MLGFYTKKLAVISTTSVLVTDNREDKEKISIQDLKTVKCIIWNVKLNQSNKEVSILLDSGSETNLISQT